jgi:2-keto-4-pentenoate hydratase/2-oxohepta-3-ene-1,7-dioic acid hydratase in catechol pathway
MQMSNTANLIFPVEALISYLSHNMTLLAGTVILTGTPGGVGHFLDPPVYLKPGDVVEVEIDGIGTLRNPVAADPYSGWTPTTRFAARGSTPSAGPEEGQDE